MNFPIVSNVFKIIVLSAASLDFLFGSGASLAKEPDQIAALKPIPFTASYDLHKGDIKLGEAIYSFKHVGNNDYSLTGSASLSGVLALLPNATATVESQWKYINGHIQPVRYHYNSSVAMISKEMLSIFDWPNHVAIVKHNGVVRQVALKKGYLDKSLVPIAVMLDLKKGQLKNEYFYVDRRRVKQYKFKKIGQEQIKTALGSFKAIIVENVQKSKKRKKVKRRTIFWSALELDYLPVRVRYKSGDDTKIVMTLTRLKGELGYRLKK